MLQYRIKKQIDFGVLSYLYIMNYFFKQLLTLFNSTKILKPFIMLLISVTGAKRLKNLYYSNYNYETGKERKK